MNEAEFWIDLDTLEREVPQLADRVKHLLNVREWNIKRVGAEVKGKEVRFLFEFMDGYQSWSDDVQEKLIAHLLIVHIIENFDRVFFKEREGR